MQAIDDYINNVRSLPPAPRVVPELIRLLNQPDVDSSKIVTIVSYDPSLTANVLRVCNSAFYAAATPISDLQEAVTRLGFQQVYKLVTASTGARMLSPPQFGYGLESGELWKHSVAAAVAAQLIARKVGEDENLAFTATLLHDIGKIVLSGSMDGAYTKIIKETENSAQSLLDAEKKILGVNHAEVGGRLLNRWNFPANITTAVACHHAPKSAGSHQRLAAQVYLGNMISYFMGHGYGHVPFAIRGRGEVLAVLNLEPESIPQFMLEAFDQMHIVEALFAIAE